MSGYHIKTRTRVLSFPGATHVGIDPASNPPGLAVMAGQEKDQLLLFFAPGEWVAFWPSSTEVPSTMQEGM